MRTILMLLTVSLTALARPELAIAQAEELPNVPVVSGGWHVQRMILRNRSHLSSYMAGLAPEFYRDALTDFIVRNNPKK